MKELSKEAEMGAFREFYNKDAVILKVLNQLEAM
jgi:hypothetical protein